MLYEDFEFIERFIFYSYHIAKFKKCIKEHRFFQAHEVFEELWFPKRHKKDSKTKIIRGFINAAVAFELYKRGKKESAYRVWQNYLKHSKTISLDNFEFSELKDFIDTFALNYFKDLVKV